MSVWAHDTQEVNKHVSVKPCITKHNTVSSPKYALPSPSLTSNFLHRYFSHVNATEQASSEYAFSELWFSSLIMCVPKHTPKHYGLVHWPLPGFSLLKAQIYVVSSPVTTDDASCTVVLVHQSYWQFFQKVTAVVMIVKTVNPKRNIARNRGDILVEYLSKLMPPTPLPTVTYVIGDHHIFI